MKNWFYNIGEKIKVFMYGRYGFDELSIFLSIAALIFVLLSPILELLNILAFALLIWSVFRTYSKNIESRRKELSLYLRYKNKLKKFFTLRQKMYQERKTHIYFKCPNCKVYLRVPKGRGKIEITCPKCHEKTTKNT